MNEDAPVLQSRPSISCSGCGATMTYDPGTTELACEHCGSRTSIPGAEAVGAEETDYESFLARMATDADQTCQVYTVSCSACGAATTLQPDVSADLCPFCASPLAVDRGASQTIVKPRYMLPFKVDAAQAMQQFRTWLHKLWFAPGTLKHRAEHEGKLKGVYIPYWTYDAATRSRYSGERGTNHMQTYTTRENGRTVTRTRTVVRWRPVQGTVSMDFNDVLVVASRSLPHNQTMELEPWDLENVCEYNEHFLSGFQVQSYQVGLREGFATAREQMDIRIRDAIRRDIGGDHQRIHSVSTACSEVTFKHLLLPVWISAYRFKSRVYRFLINGRTGEVQGERPWSWIKITLAATGAAAALGALLYYAGVFS